MELGKREQKTTPGELHLQFQLMLLWEKWNLGTPCPCPLAPLGILDAGRIEEGDPCVGRCRCCVVWIFVWVVQLSRLARGGAAKNNCSQDGKGWDVEPHCFAAGNEQDLPFLQLVTLLQPARCLEC